MNIEVNYIAVLVAAVVSTILGFIWYSPFVLGKPWAKEKGLTSESLKKAQKEMGKWYGVSFIVSIVQAYVLFHIITLSLNFFHYSELTTGLTTAFWAWLGFVLPTQFGAAIFGNKNWKLLGIDTGYQLISLIGMGVALALV